MSTKKIHFWITAALIYFPSVILCSSCWKQKVILSFQVSILKFQNSWNIDVFHVHVPPPTESPSDPRPITWSHCRPSCLLRCSGAATLVKTSRHLCTRLPTSDSRLAQLTPVISAAAAAIELQRYHQSWDADVKVGNGGSSPELNYAPERRKCSFFFSISGKDQSRRIIQLSAVIRPTGRGLLIRIRHFFFLLWRVAETTLQHGE